MSAGDFEQIWEPLKRAVSFYRKHVDERPVMPLASRERMHAELNSYDFSSPMEMDLLVQDVGRMLGEWKVQTPHRRYYGLYNPDVVPASVAADTMVAAFNPQLAAYTHAPGPCEIEAHTLRFFSSLIWNEGDAAAWFTSGGAEANHSAVLAALAAHFPCWIDHGARGLSGQPVMYVTSESHHTFLKIAQSTGLGRAGLRQVPTDESLRMDVTALQRQVREDRASGLLPFLVVATAGTTATGAIDALPEIGRVCAEEDLWMHCDAAWGGGALLSPRLRGHLQGIACSDSVTFDAHKWLSVPMAAGMFFCRHSDAVSQAFNTIGGSYMPRPGEGLDPYQHSMQWSRRHIGLKVFMALASLGKDGYARLIDDMAAVADTLADELRTKGWRVVAHSPLAVVCFDHPSVTEPPRFLQDVYRRAHSWISLVQLPHGRQAFRACVTNYRTTPEDARETVAELERIRTGG